MGGPIAVDLAGAQKCTAADMIRFLLAFCQSGGDKTTPVHNEDLLQRAFLEAKKVANQEGTTLRTNLKKFLNAKKEIDMYAPFVRACNYALDKFSGSQIEGLSNFSEDKRIVFVCSHNQPVPTRHHARRSQVRPDIVLLSWKSFNKSKNARYSASYEEDICTNKPVANLVWDRVRSTVEMKLAGLPKRVDWKTFDMEFKDLAESGSYPPPNYTDGQQPKYIQDPLPNIHYSTRSSARFAGEGEHVTVEDIRMPSIQTRKISALLHDSNSHEEEPAAEWSEGSEPSTQGGGQSGKDVSGSSQPSEIPEKHPVNIQNGIYAAERLSCSLEVTHSVNFILCGTTIYLTWSDRQSVIQARGFDVIQNLPHFLLVLLIIQRFDLARWGFFTEFEGSKIRQLQGSLDRYVLEATFVGDKPIHIFPQDDPIHSGINLVGRSTGAAGARYADNGTPSSSEKIRNTNPMIVKFSWPEEARASEVDIIKKAMEIGENNELVDGHLPRMLGDIDPPYMTCSTRIIREFLGLETTGARVLRVIAFNRLEELRYLDEEHMLIAFLDCFFCHWALWRAGILHGDISIGNLMYDLMTKRGVLNDFDLARLCGQDGKPSGKDNTGTMPFMALDLLKPSAFRGMVPRLYRHDAESFTWCLIYICVCMEKDGNGQILVTKPHPLLSWFTDPNSCYQSKTDHTSAVELFRDARLHKGSVSLAKALRSHWITRFFGQETSKAKVLDDDDDGDAQDMLMESGDEADGTIEPYVEPDDHKSFEKVFKIIKKAKGAIPFSRREDFRKLLECVTNL